MSGLKEFSVAFEIKDIDANFAALFFGPEFWEWLMQPQIEEWENEGGAIR
jgi:hypothetical protein